MTLLRNLKNAYSNAVEVLANLIFKTKNHFVFLAESLHLVLLALFVLNLSLGNVMFLNKVFLLLFIFIGILKFTDTPQEFKSILKENFPLTWDFLSLFFLQLFIFSNSFCLENNFTDLIFIAFSFSCTTFTQGFMNLKKSEHWTKILVLSVFGFSLFLVMILACTYPKLVNFILIYRSLLTLNKQLDMASSGFLSSHLKHLYHLSFNIIFMKRGFNKVKPVIIQVINEAPKSPNPDPELLSVTARWLIGGTLVGIGAGIGFEYNGKKDLVEEHTAGIKRSKDALMDPLFHSLPDREANILEQQASYRAHNSCLDDPVALSRTRSLMFQVTHWGQTPYEYKKSKYLLDSKTCEINPNTTIVWDLPKKKTDFENEPEIDWASCYK